jgi:GxxExxY protein
MPPIAGVHTAITSQVLAAAFEVSNTLGAGFLEKVYERALLRELSLRGLLAIAQKPQTVTYKGECVGDYYPDILVEDAVIVELKCVECFAPEHMAQCLNYLKASQKRICLLLNFQRPRLQYKRLIL